ncbi:hypothetical protein KFK09_002280 [Dendrobium nobile]|uniref:Uncharacterized protein n=1 Tax=Dendrobium nobile TaxID=94219 RepID=A0A8T3C7I1_DENNO|nr:hypothetical protein KFK09_002280 [Dendrobium nobile]
MSGSQIEVHDSERASIYINKIKFMPRVGEEAFENMNQYFDKKKQLQEEAKAIDHKAAKYIIKLLLEDPNAPRKKRIWRNIDIL